MQHTCLATLDWLSKNACQKLQVLRCDLLCLIYGRTCPASVSFKILGSYNRAPAPGEFVFTVQNCRNLLAAVKKTEVE